jgi:hypothetical protein
MPFTYLGAPFIEALSFKSSPRPDFSIKRPIDKVISLFMVFETFNYAALHAYYYFQEINSRNFRNLLTYWNYFRSFIISHKHSQICS